MNATAPWIDVTVPVRTGMVVWPGDPGVQVVRVQDIARGDGITVSRLDLGAHTGTHVDAPLHFIGGAQPVDQLDPEGLVGPARVVAIPDDAPVITGAMIEALAVERGDRIVFRTRNSERCWNDDRFHADYTYLSLDGARLLVARGARTVAIDYLSIAGGDEVVATHQTLLSAGVCIIEGLNLSAVVPGRYDLVCLPLRIEGADGAPARAMLRRRG